MIQDFRETLEVTPLLPTDGVSLDMMPDHMPLCLNKTPSNFVFVCFPQIDQGRICVCVRKRPLSKQGMAEVFISISPENEK